MEQDESARAQVQAQAMTEPGGVWLLNEATDDLTYVETHRGSTIASSWPVGDSETLYAIQRGCDWLLNAAGAGFEAYRAALRARWPGDARGLTTDSKPWQFWHRTFYGLSGGATRRLFMGDLDRATRSNGFIIDDSKDGDTVTGWDGGTNSTGLFRQMGEGPGRGIGAGTAGWGGGGGGSAVAGESSGLSNHTTRGAGGLAVPAHYVLRAVIENDYAKVNWLAAGSGAGGASSNPVSPGGDSGGGIVRIGLNALTESTNRTLTGGNSTASGSHSTGGGGSGGVYLAIAGADYTLSSGTTINCEGGTAGTGSTSNGTGGDGGNGHIIIMAHGDITLTGTTSNAVVTQWRIIAAPPPGGSFVTNP